MTRYKNQARAEEINLFRYEYQFQNWLRNAAKARGWLYYHTHRSDRSEPGFPDTVMVRRNRVLYAELKMPGNKPTPAQRKWINALRAADQEAYVWYPEDLKTIEGWLA